MGIIFRKPDVKIEKGKQVLTENALQAFVMLLLVVTLVLNQLGWLNG